MSLPLPADHTAPAPPVGAPWPANGRPLGQRIRVPKTAELVAAELRRKIVRGELAEGGRRGRGVVAAAPGRGRELPADEQVDDHGARPSRLTRRPWPILRDMSIISYTYNE